jgi:hypothetical protein
MKLLNVEIGLVCVMLIIFKVPQFYAKFSSLCLWRIKYSGKKSSNNTKAAVAVENHGKAAATKRSSSSNNNDTLPYCIPLVQ